MIGIKALFEAFGQIPAVVRWIALGVVIPAGIAAATLAAPPARSCIGFFADLANAVR